MFFEDKLPKNKDINYLEDKESKHPLLQLIYNTKQNKKVDESSNILISPNSSKYNSSSSLLLKNKNKNEKNDPQNNVENSQNKIKKNSKNNNNINIEESNNVDSKSNNSSNVSISYYNKRNNNEEKLTKIIDFSSDFSNNSETKNNMKENQFSLMRQKSTITSNNLMFPKICKPNNIEKDGEYNTIVNLKYNPQNLINNQNYNNNSIYISEPKKSNYSFLQKFNENKTKYQKSIEFCLLRNKISNNSYNSRFLTFSTSNKISFKNSEKNTELKGNLNTIETDNSNKLKNSLFLRNNFEKGEINNKIFNRRKSVNFNYKPSLLKLKRKNNNFPENIVNNQLTLNKSKKNIFFSLPKNEKLISKSVLNKFNDDTISISPILKERVNIKRLTIKKSNKIVKKMMGLGEIKETNDKNIKKNTNNNINNINSIENLNNIKRNEANFRYPYRRDKGKRMTQVYDNNFSFFNNLLDRKYEIINNNNNKNIDNLKKHFNENKKSIRKNIKHFTIMNIVNKNSKAYKLILQNQIKSNNFSLINKKSNDKNFLVKENFSSRSESFSSSGNSENTIILIHKKENYNPFESRNIFDNYTMDKDEEKYINKKRTKLIDEAIEDNKSSYLFNIYNEELKNYFIKNCVVDKITENIFKDFEPLENKVESKKESEQKIKNCIKTSFNQILKKSHKYLNSFEKTINLGKSLIKEENIKIELKINSKYFLDTSHIYKELLKQFELKWNNKKTKEYYYKRMLQVFSLGKKSKSQKLFYHNRKGEKKKKTLEKIDKDFYLYKERIKKFINLNINSLHLRLMDYNKEIIDIDRKSRFNSKQMINISKYYKNQSKALNSKLILSRPNIKMSIFRNSRENTSKITRKRRTSEDGGENKKLSNFLKIQKEFGLNGKNESFAKFAKLYRISIKPKLSSKLDYIIKKFKEEFNEKKNKDAVSQKELLFNQAKNDLDNYNILKNREMFSYTINNQFDIGKRFSKMFNLKKNKILLDKKLKIDSMTIKFAGIDQLTKEASLIKTQEMENDLPDMKFFEKIVHFFQKRNISKFEDLVQSRPEAFNKIVNKQEFTTGNTLLIYATQYNLKSVIELLLLKGADPNIQNKFGNSALHLAYNNDNVFIINLLIEHGADTKLKNCNRILPWQMSKFIN